MRVSMMKEEAISPKTQRAAIGEIPSRKNVVIVDWVEDLDVTGRTFKRKITTLIDRVRDGEADGIAVWKYSRFGRQRKGNALYISELEDAGGVLVSATEDFDTSTATGKFGRGMLLEFAAFESDRAGEIWAETYSHRVREGLPPLGRDRFGYRREGRVQDEEDPKRTRHVRGEQERYVPDEERGSAALAGAYRKYTAGATFQAVTDRLNADGWRTTYGGRWKTGTVRGMLDSGFGAGFLRVHDPRCQCKKKKTCSRHVLVRGAHEAVIIPEEWEAYLARRKLVAAAPPRSRQPRCSMTGLARCGHCKAALVLHAVTDGVQYMMCSRRRGYKDCEGPLLSAARIEAAVREAVTVWADDIDNAAKDAARLSRRRDAAVAVERLKAEVDGHRQKLAKLALARADDTAAGGILGDDAWVDAALSIRADRDRALADLEAARQAAAAEPLPATEAAATLFGLMESWDLIPPHELNAILRTVVRRVVVYRDGNRRERSPAGHWMRLSARFEVLPVWEPDPWAGTLPRRGVPMTAEATGI